MPENNSLLDLDGLRKTKRQGLRIDGHVYAWLIIGPIETVQITALQNEIAEISGNDLTLDIAEQLVAKRRELLQTIVPKLPDEIEKDMNEEEVELAIRFFDVWRMNVMVSGMEDQLTPAEKASQMAERARSIGERSFQLSKDSTMVTPPLG